MVIFTSKIGRRYFPPHWWEHSYTYWSELFVSGKCLEKCVRLGGASQGGGGGRGENFEKNGYVWLRKEGKGVWIKLWLFFFTNLRCAHIYEKKQLVSNKKLMITWQKIKTFFITYRTFLKLKNALKCRINFWTFLRMQIEYQNRTISSPVGDLRRRKSLDNNV